MTSDLLPCPFCGKEPKYKFSPENECGSWDTHNTSCVMYNKHDVQVIELSKEDAIKAWNTRPAEGGHARTMLKVEIAPGIEVFMTANQKTAWEALKK